MEPTAQTTKPTALARQAIERMNLGYNAEVTAYSIAANWARMTPEQKGAFLKEGMKYAATNAQQLNFRVLVRVLVPDYCPEPSANNAQPAHTKPTCQSVSTLRQKLGGGATVLDGARDGLNLMLPEKGYEIATMSTAATFNKPSVITTQVATLVGKSKKLPEKIERTFDYDEKGLPKGSYTERTYPKKDRSEHTTESVDAHGMRKVIEAPQTPALCGR